MSNLLEDIICNVGSPSAECTMCHTTHFTAEEEDNELAILRKYATECPDKFVESSEDGISHGEFGGHRVVWGCGCRKIEKYEDLIWNNRRVILEYIKRRATAEKKSAEETLRGLQDV